MLLGLRTLLTYIRLHIFAQIYCVLFSVGSEEIASDLREFTELQQVRSHFI